MLQIQIVGYLLLFEIINKANSRNNFILTKVAFVLVIYVSQREAFGKS